jgi:hypothetical protein
MTHQQVKDFLGTHTAELKKQFDEKFPTVVNRELFFEWAEDAQEYRIALIGAVDGQKYLAHETFKAADFEALTDDSISKQCAEMLNDWEERLFVW